MDDALHLMARALTAMRSALSDLDDARCSPEIGAHLTMAMERLQAALDAAGRVETQGCLGHKP